MSPVSPKPCKRRTAGPLPPTRTCSVVPLVAISRVANEEGNAWILAAAGEASRVRTSARENRRVMQPPAMKYEAFPRDGDREHRLGERLIAEWTSPRS